MGNDKRITEYEFRQVMSQDERDEFGFYAIKAGCDGFLNAQQMRRVNELINSAKERLAKRNSASQKTDRPQRSACMRG